MEPAVGGRDLTARLQAPERGAHRDGRPAEGLVGVVRREVVPAAM